MSVCSAIWAENGYSPALSGALLALPSPPGSRQQLAFSSQTSEKAGPVLSPPPPCTGRHSLLGGGLAHSARPLRHLLKTLVSFVHADRAWAQSPDPWRNIGFPTAGGWGKEGRWPA